ncbi:DUF1488 family protein [Noviherbaspirillum cavernae]|uniref:DUF1488 family protein n=1 Tax=Noviherbaspirillum cavernae TaxID=2320862 RepID=A0A418WW00_9BURK|nr:DUF1488 family protein [Noviherbaspirillum cavernae]RJF96833.1 DUF1488 family protein [Noviherbaspirillum cavernae]
MTTTYTNDGARDGLWFSIEIEKDEFLAFISTEALAAHFRTPKKRSDAIAAYKENQNIIDAVARHKFLNGFPRPIKLGAADF